MRTLRQRIRQLLVSILGEDRLKEIKQSWTEFRHGKNPAGLEKEILAHTGNGSCGDCWTQSQDLLRKALEMYPGAPVEFLVRNFNPDGIKTLTVYVPGLGRFDRAYEHYIHPSMLSAELAGFLDRFRDESGTLCVSDFVENGPEIARIIGRRVTIVHQYGSGDPDMAEFDDYGPYYPSRFLNFFRNRMVKPQSWGFIELGSGKVTEFGIAVRDLPKLFGAK